MEYCENTGDKLEDCCCHDCEQRELNKAYDEHMEDKAQAARDMALLDDLRGK